MSAPLKILPDSLGDENHDRLDQGILCTVPDFMNPEPPDWLDSWQEICLLKAIVSKSEGTLDEKYIGAEEAVKVLGTSDELRTKLASAWRNKSFREIRNIAILRKNVRGSENPRQSLKRTLSDREQQGLMVALTEPYQGVGVDALCEYLEQINRDFFSRRQYYARFCAVVQSSGTGKTRTLLELSRKGVLLFYMNLRPTEDKVGFPLRDDVPASILTEKCGSEDHYRVKCCALLGAIFKLVGDYLSSRPTDGVIENWNRIILDFKASSRADFFKELRDVYDKVMKDMLVKMGVGDATGLSPADGGKRYDVPDPSTPEEEMKGNYRKLRTLLSSTFLGVPEDKPKLVIVFDEAHPLHESEEFPRSIVLLRAIKAYSEISGTTDGVWVVFASTTSKVVHFSSPQASFNSSRVSAGGQLLFPPFTGIGWDQHAPPLKSIPDFEIATVEHIMRYGRPLWVSLKGAFDPTQIFDLAVEKLSGPQPYNGVDQRRALAVLAQRFGLDICFGHPEAVGYVESAIASHLRVCITTTEDRLWSYTTYPSEPFLSCAAAYQLHQSTQALQATLITLQGKVYDGMVDIGQSGELVSRLLWLLAKDFFLLRDRKLGTTPVFRGNRGFKAELITCQMVPVVEFFEFIFGDGFWSRCSTVHQQGPTAKEAFTDAYINFSHWVSMDANIRQKEKVNRPLDQLDLHEWTLRHWQRTSGVQCCHNQPLIDKVIPVYFKPANRGGWEDCMSQIFISDKARVGKSPRALHNVQRRVNSIGGSGGSSKRPYIAILADLGVVDEEKVGLESVTFSRRRSGRRAKDAQCLRIHAVGLGTKTYPFLGKYSVVLAILQNLISRHNLPESKRPLATSIQDRIQYGSSAEKRHMVWEGGKRLEL